MTPLQQAKQVVIDRFTSQIKRGIPVGSAETVDLLATDIIELTMSLNCPGLFDCLSQDLKKQVMREMRQYGIEKGSLS
jgi:hypothetical protein